MSIFQQWQPKFAEFGIPTFPMDGSSKKPRVSHYQKIGGKASSSLVNKFSTATAIGFVAGKKSRLTILDIDKPCEKLLADCLSLHGQSPLIARTASGKYHIYYAYNGEKRSIRPFHDETGADLPIDVLGDGIAIAPPSMSKGNAYEFIEGDLYSVPTLQPMIGLENQFRQTKQSQNGRSSKITEGNRDRALFCFLLKQAHHCDSIEVLKDIAFNFADQELDRFNGHEFSDAQILQKVEQVWRMTLDGNNYSGTGHQFNFSGAFLDCLLPLGADATALYMYMRRMWGAGIWVENFQTFNTPPPIFRHRQGLHCTAQ